MNVLFLPRVLVLFAFLLLSASLIWCGEPDFDYRFTEGTHEGFTIGSTGPEAYAQFRVKRLEKGNSGDLECHGFDADGSRLAAAGASYGLWRDWSVQRGRYYSGKGFDLLFRQDTVYYANVWGAPKPPELVSGTRWDSALSLVKRVAREGLWDSLKISLSEKNFDKEYDACLVDSAFGPYASKDTANVWKLGLKTFQDCSAELKLIFRKGLLVEIRHSRECEGGLF